MGMVLTLIAGLGGRSSLPCLAPAIAATLKIGLEPDWLAPGEACDLVLDTTCPAGVEETARALINAAQIDVVVQPVAGRRKRLLVADLESTIIENEMLDELAERLGIRPQVAEITRRAMNGEIDFVTALEARVALLKGMGARVLKDAAERIRLTPGARALVATMRRAVAAIAPGFNASNTRSQASPGASQTGSASIVSAAATAAARRGSSEPAVPAIRVRAMRMPVRPTPGSRLATSGLPSNRASPPRQSSSPVRPPAGNPRWRSDWPKCLAGPSLTPTAFNVTAIWRS